MVIFNYYLFPTSALFHRKHKFHNFEQCEQVYPHSFIKLAINKRGFGHKSEIKIITLKILFSKFGGESL